MAIWNHTWSLAIEEQFYRSGRSRSSPSGAGSTLLDVSSSSDTALAVMSVVAWGGLELGAATGERSYFGSDTRTEAPLLGLDGRSRLLSSRPMVWSGERSYSLYLWHVPVILFLIEPLDAVLPALRIGAMVGISVALAVASYQLVERPFRRGLPRLDRPVPAPGSVATRRSV